MCRAEELLTLSLYSLLPFVHPSDQISQSLFMTNFVIQRKPRQARYFTEDLGNDVGLDMVLIPGGEFWMGSLESEEGHHPNESPRHRVKVPTFLLGRYPVTQAQWKQIAQGTPQANLKLEPNPSHFKGLKHPVEQVNWHEAVEFCSRLSTKTHRTYRLPSEAEWEYACRGETDTPFHFGKTMNTDVSNYRGQDWKMGETRYPGVYGAGPRGEYRAKTIPVDYFNASNRFGLCDMHGNVWEWCQDTWHETYKGAPTDGSAWMDKNETYFRILRGGSWLSRPGFCRSANRVRTGTGECDYDLGFRVVCAVPRLL
jgi:formylglycine-generating enzyme required for sulfatase activity